MPLPAAPSLCVGVIRRIPRIVHPDFPGVPGWDRRRRSVGGPRARHPKDCGAKGLCMNAIQTRAVIEHYFDLMGGGRDFSVCYADDVRFTTFDGGRTVVGPTDVRDYLVELHSNMPEGDGRPMACVDGAVYLEGDFPDPRSTAGDRIAWCLAYDIADGLITAGRLYGAVGFLVPAR